MKWFADYKHPKQLYFIIEHDITTGFYIYMYEDSVPFRKDLQEEGCPHHRDDYLQDTLEIAKECAFDIYGVPLDVWKPVE